ncbi:MAG TPA: deoxyribonuclease IV [Exilispira sp.]|mgnify:CR=1 FL=1|nr:deoxyribonuclease IV [Exilispira sp.]
MEFDIRFGSHISIKNGLASALKTAKNLGFHSIQVFTKNATRWTSKSPEDKDISEFIKLLKDKFFFKIVAHASYLINLASFNTDILEKSLNSIQDELNRCELYNIPFYVIHPGSHMGEGVTKGLDQVVKSFNSIKIPSNVQILLETTAGQGSNLGSSFEELSYILSNVDKKESFAICYDTCHTFAAGYDIRTKEDFNNTMELFDKIVGIKNIKAIHVNDSKFPLGSKKDRHEHIGKGFIGIDGFKFFVNFKPFKDIPFLLETEKSEDYHEDIENCTKLQNLIND